MRLATILATVPLLMLADSADAQRGRWHTVGSTTVNLGVDRTTIRVNRRDRHQQVRLCVNRRAVHVNSFRVSFASGRDQSVPVHRLVRTGECTRASDLRSRSPGIRSVWMSFLRLRSGTRPVVRVEAR